MKIITGIHCVLTLILLSFIGSASAEPLLFRDHPLAGKIWDMKSREFIDESSLLAMANKSDVLLLGETHDNPVHHELQQKLLAASFTKLL